MSEQLQIKDDEELQDALLKLFDLAELEPPTLEITGRDVMLAVNELKDMMEEAAASAPATSGIMGGAPPAAGEAPAPDLGTLGGGGDGDDPFGDLASALGGKPKENKAAKGRQILIAGELGIVTYQLKLALTKHGSEVTIVKGVDEAIQEYKRRPYSDVLIDIFMPTEREGLMVLMEIKRMAIEKKQQTNVIVIATPVKDRRVDLKEICRQRGANFFLLKTEGWHQRVIDYFTGNA